MRDAVTEINIENPAAKEAFIRWWRTMETQGYSYGFEALCNVWVGFNDGRKVLAQKVFETIQATATARLVEDFAEHRSGYEVKGDIKTALRELFQREGIEVEEGS